MRFLHRLVVVPGALARSLSPRDARAAQRWACASIVSAMLTSFVVQWLTSPDGTNVAAVGSTALVLGVAALVLRLPARVVAPWVVSVPLLGIVLIVKLDLPSGDAGVTGQVFFTVPVVWAATHLRWCGIALVTAATVAGEAVVVFSLLPLGQAVVDCTLMSALLGVLAGVLGRAASARQRLVEELAEQAGVDALTGLATRRVLDDATARLRAEPGVRASLVLLDLDRFKAINDTHGHLGGDAALVHVASVPRGCCRPGDVVARMGGDELAVLLVDTTPAAAAELADRFVDAVRRSPLHLPDGAVVPLSLSAGTAPLTASGDPGEDPYARADEALYAAKRAGRDRAVAAVLSA
ncbi:GGDEF domain-containing protein [Kineococcus sp. DHX-1]|uniref:GGDEF domain-containing protein n=1 Tax=Kineococcus sp. DHX-1 TaxID=3349638 RepID=UPI0036D34BE7